MTLGFIFGAYLTETFRGAILAIPRADGGWACLWLTRGRVLRRINPPPQNVRHAVPGFTNNWLVMIKATALLSIIGLDDLVHRANLASAATRQPSPSMPRLARSTSPSPRSRSRARLAGAALFARCQEGRVLMVDWALIADSLPPTGGGFRSACSDADLRQRVFRAVGAAGDCAGLAQSVAVKASVSLHL